MSVHEFSKKIGQFVKELEEFSIEHDGLELKPFNEDGTALLSFFPSEYADTAIDALYDLQGLIDNRMEHMG